MFTPKSRLTAPQARVGDLPHKAGGATGAADQGIRQLDVAVNKASTMHVVKAFREVSLEAVATNNTTPRKKKVGVMYCLRVQQVQALARVDG